MGNTRDKVSAIILHIPHSSTHIPEEYRYQFTLSDDELERENLRITDHFTDDLFSGLQGQYKKVVAPVSRLLVDMERFADDEQEPMAIKGVGCIYRTTSTGKPLRHQISDKERQNLMQEYYYPHHEVLTDTVDEILKNSSRCLIIDCHSFPSTPLSYDENQVIPRPDICLGSDRCHTPKELVETAKIVFEKYKLSVEVNTPYSGTMVPIKHYHSDTRVQSLMIEVNRKLYMNENTGKQNCSFLAIQQLLHECFSMLSE